MFTRGILITWCSSHPSHLMVVLQICPGSLSIATPPLLIALVCWDPIHSYLSEFSLLIAAVFSKGHKQSSPKSILNYVALLRGWGLVQEITRKILLLAFPLFMALEQGFSLLGSIR